MKVYNRICFVAGPTVPGGPPRAYSATVGGKIERRQENGCDDYVLTTSSGHVYEGPWSSVLWACPGPAPERKPLPITTPIRTGRVRQEPASIPPVDAEADDEPPSQKAEGASVSSSPSTSGEWKPPRKPKQRTRKAAPEQTSDAG